MSRAVHKLIATTAKEMAACWYDERARKDAAFHKANPSQDRFASQHWGLWVKLAREQLTRMLGGNYPEQWKTEIYEALIADHTLH